jgi:hypothetical protein
MPAPPASIPFLRPRRAIAIVVFVCRQRVGPRQPAVEVYVGASLGAERTKAVDLRVAAYRTGLRPVGGADSGTHETEPGMELMG